MDYILTYFIKLVFISKHTSNVLTTILLYRLYLLASLSYAVKHFFQGILHVWGKAYFLYNDLFLVIP